MPENGETGRENGQPKTCHTYGKRGDSGLKGTPGSDGDLAKDDGNRVTKVSTKSGQEAAKKSPPAEALHRDIEMALPSRNGDIAKTVTLANRG
jgi:hypothetical protein